MTLRALITGSAAAIFIAGFGYINDRVFVFDKFTSGHLLPIIVIGLLLLTVLVLNPILFRVRRSWAFRPSELTLVVVLTMVSCSIPGGGMMEQFIQIPVMPFHWNRVNPGWREHNLLGYAPQQALVDSSDHDAVVTAFITGVQGAGVSDPPFLAGLKAKLGRVPWASWRAPLLTWLPLFFLTAVSSASLALLVHRQWSSHELLSYPIAAFTASLLERDGTGVLPSVLRNRVFWLGFGAILLVRLNNAACKWYPEYLVPVRFAFSFSPVGTLWPSIHKAPFGSSLLYLRVFPLVIAFAFFLSSEVSLTLGLTQVLWVLFAVPMVTFGVKLGTQYGKGGWSGWQRAGSYVAFALMLAYTGRHYYRETLLRAIRIWRRTLPEGAGVWACRVFLASTCLLIAMVMGLGLELPFAVGTILLMLISFLVVCRISAETGLFWIHPRWQPYGVLLGFCGSFTMPPEAVVISALVCTVLCINQGEVLMPYLCNGLKLCERADIGLPKATGLALGTYAAGVLVAVVVVLAASYDVGTPTDFNWAYQRIPTMPFRDAEPEVLRLKATGLLAEAEATPWYGRLGRIQPREHFLWAAGFGFAGVIVLSALRLRFPRWPLHPALFLLWATWPMIVLSHSFLLGWFVKRTVVRYGGHAAVRKLKPLMIGVIAGEITGAFLCMVAGVIYYIVTGERQISYRFIP